MELSKPSKPQENEQTALRPISEAPATIQVVYSCCLAIARMELRGKKSKVFLARQILDAQVHINRAQLKLVPSGEGA